MEKFHRGRMIWSFRLQCCSKRRFEEDLTSLFTDIYFIDMEVWVGRGEMVILERRFPTPNDQGITFILILSLIRSHSKSSSKNIYTFFFKSVSLRLREKNEYIEVFNFLFRSSSKIYILCSSLFHAWKYCTPLLINANAGFKRCGKTKKIHSIKQKWNYR